MTRDGMRVLEIELDESMRDGVELIFDRISKGRDFALHCVPPVDLIPVCAVADIFLIDSVMEYWEEYKIHFVKMGTLLAAYQSPSDAHLLEFVCRKVACVICILID